MIKEKIKIICFDNPVHEKNHVHLNYKKIDIHPSPDLLAPETTKGLILEYIYYNGFLIKIRNLYDSDNNDTTMTMTTTYMCHLK
jgi:hypothetical protein